MASGGLVEDAFDLAAVDAEFAGYGALAASGVVPGPYCLLHARCFGQRGRCASVRNRQGVAHLHRGLASGAGVALGPYQGHEEFEGAGQRQGGPGADQSADGAVAEAVRQVGADGGRDAGAEAPAREVWHGRWRRFASRMSMLAARMRPSTVNGTSRAVTPVSPWVLTSS